MRRFDRPAEFPGDTSENFEDMMEYLVDMIDAIEAPDKFAAETELKKESLRETLVDLRAPILDEKLRSKMGRLERSLANRTEIVEMLR